MITWQTQETECWRKGTSWDEVVVGSPDKVLKVRYAISITRDGEKLDDEVTSGWKIAEVSDYGSSYGRSILPASDTIV
jgi:hypothetical protein